MNVELIFVTKEELASRIGQPVCVKGIYPDEKYRWGIVAPHEIQHADGTLSEDFYEQCTFLALADYDSYVKQWLK